MTTATLTNENIQLGLAYSLDFSPLSSLWEAPRRVGRLDA